MKTKNKMLQFTVLYETDEDNMFIASVPSIPRCYTQAKTFEQARKRIKEVIELCLKDQPEYAKIFSPNFKEDFLEK